MARDTLDTLIRLAEAEVDAARLALQKVLAEEDAIRAKLRDLAVQVEYETSMAAKDTALAQQYGVFIDHVKRKRHVLNVQLDAMKPKVEAARDALGEAFGNQKKYEIAKQNRDEAIAADRNRKDGLAMDELGLNAFRRNHE
ncbi:MAG: flagellar export protein FliJ [Alphaproteobacteria bacterium]|nr:flagellar export protein FliJ [Alphaproteobacteria bacterium]